MAISNNNVQNIKFLRNQAVNITRDAAISLLNAHKEDSADGTALLARYTVSGTVKTIVGFVYVTGSTHDITIFDTEGASGDVEKLREEINAILGDGVGSGASETVTAQLTALSGNGQSTSAETSVEGAKRYADELKNQMDYSGVTTGTGVYVTNVTQADGIVSATTATLPSVDDTAVAKKFVIEVDQTNGEISVSRGEITSSAQTIVLTDNTDGGVNFEVNIDNDTIVQDETSKVLKVASAALTQYVGDEDTIHISDADAQNNKTVSSLLTISATTPSEANVKEQYNLVGASGNTIGATIKIYKDSALLSVALLHADTTANPQVLPTYNKTNGWSDIPETAQTQANQALCYAYEDVSGNTLVAAVPVGAFINEQEFASGVTWDATANKVKGVVDPTSEKDSQDTPVDFLTVGADGFKVNGIRAEIERQLDTVVAGLDATVTGATSGNHVTISIEELDGKLVQSGLTIQENDIASATDLAELSGKTITAITSTNGSITASISNELGNKTADIQTDASKIKMSGFTSSDALSGITSSSSITEAFMEVDNVITTNEQVTAAALTDLDERIEAVSGDVETLSAKTITSVTVNDKAVAVANGVAPISISAATSSVTTTGNEAIVVNTDANGNITLGIANIDCGYYDDTQG